ncbi:hypothetical protein NAT51_03735 [Flavobacterium amniphilum]|uniref:hypothetical protein n=1 Tax=Flavobacterium amniphilum TaxID=1834035 RepID=UPI00202ABE4A|nr:hypothetical protein [Flavobacterium amniphilum]MCL9804618.1 hypothetical protein [Flavobacterium amniphilum]
MILIVFKYLTPKGFRGITFYPFVIMTDKKDKQNPVFVNHEHIHIKQQLELLVIPFFIWYGIEFMIRLIQYKNRHKAYRNICFEREAYANEKDLDYLKSRPFWGFSRFVFSRLLS